MTGFLPLLTASNGTAPSAAADTATPKTGAEGAFASVLAEMAGAEKGANHAGFAVQRLKLAFAASDAMPAAFDLGGFEVKVDGVRFVRTGDAPAGERNGAELARLAPQAGGKPEGARTVEAQRQPLISGIFASDILPADTQAEQAAPAKPSADEALEADTANAAALAALAATQPQPAARPVVSPENLGNDIAFDMPPAPILAIEPAAGDVETPQHDVTAMAETRPLTATVTALPTQPAQAWTNPNAGVNAGENGAANAVPLDAVRAAPKPVAETLAAETRAAAQDAAAPVIGQAASAVREMAGEPRRSAPAFSANAPADAAPVNAAAGLAGVAPMSEAPNTGAPTTDALAGLTVEAPEQAAKAAAQTVTAQNAFAQNMTPQTKNGAGDLPLIEPAAGHAPEAAEAWAGADADDAVQSDRFARNGEPQSGQNSTGQNSAGQTSTGQNSAAQTPAAQTAASQFAQTAQAAALPEGFQPVENQVLGTQPLHSQTQAQPGLPHGADVVRVATPQQVPEAVGIAISRHVGAEATEFTLRLDPAELGRIEVKLEMGKDGQATVSIQADNASTFDLLRRDSSALERALAEAGLKLDSGGLNFSLRQQDGQNQQQFASEGAQRPATGRMQEASLSGLEQDNTPRPTRRSGAPGLLDLSI